MPMLPRWWSTTCAIGNVLCALGVITRYWPLLAVALCVQAVTIGTYVKARWLKS